MLPLFTHLCIELEPHVVLCCVLDSDWKDVEVALDRLVFQEREASTGDSQKGIHDGSIRSVYAFLRYHRTYNFLEV